MRLASVLGLGLLASVGCMFVRAPSTERGRTASDGDSDRGFVPVNDAYRLPSTAELVREATIGVHAGTESELSSRMQLRPLAVPHPPRGATMRFNLPDGKRAWVTSMLQEQVLTTPAFAKGKVFLGGGFASHEMYALSAYTGELDWSAAAPDGGPSSAIYEDGRLLFNTESCELFVVNAETGKQQWHKWLGDPLMSQPAAAGSLVFSAYPTGQSGAASDRAGTGGSHEFGAFRLADGADVWKVPITADVIQAPQIRGDSVYIATMDGNALRIERASGRVRWRRQVGAASAPAVDGDHVLLSRKVGGQEQPIVLSASDGKIVGQSEKFEAPWFGGASRDRVLAKTQAGAWGSVPHGDHLGLTNVAAGWAYQGSTAAVADGRAYYAVGGEIRAREVATGREVWRRAYAQAKGAQAVTPPAVVGGQLVFGTVDGHLYAVDIDTGMTVWAYDLAEPIVFQPIVAQGWVYTTTAKGHVIGLELGDPSFDGWHMWGGNAEHSGLVETAGAVDPRLLASLTRPGEGTMRAARESAKGGDGAGQSAAGGGRTGTATEDDLPLVGTTVRAKVSGTVARVQVVQHFKNPFDKEIEAVYLFPLPDQAAVDDMEMKIGQRVVRADVKRRAEAQKTYSEAKASGKRAALLEQQRPNLFAERVANIAPGEAIDVSLTYAQNIALDDGRYELVFPMVAPRRYDSKQAVPAPAPTQNAKTAPPAVAAAGTDLRSPRAMDLTVELDAGLPLESLESLTHRIDAVRPAKTRAVVRLARSDAIANRDFVMRWTLGGSVPRATVLAHRDGDAGQSGAASNRAGTDQSAEGGDRTGTGYFSLVVQPPAPSAGAPIAPRDLTLLVDTSSSMRGRPIEHARAVGRRVLEGLRPTDTLRVIAFADQVHAFDPAPLPATRENVERAKGFLDSQQAVGATEMSPAIRAALTPASADPARMGLVVLVTDGFIGNEADVLSEIAQHLGSERLYAFGIGSSTNRFLLERAAEIGRGRAVVVTPSEDPAQAAARFESYLSKPVFTDVAIDWGGLDVSDVYPKHTPDLFASRPLVVTGKYRRGQKAVVRVRGTYGGKRYERAVDVDLPDKPSPSVANLAQRSLWARAAVHDRLNNMTLRDDPRLVEEVAQLGLKYRLVTPWTSFVAVDTTGPAASHPGATQAMLSPARALPGDPEIRIAAPADARAVTIDLPFGETIAAHWDAEEAVWIARFLIPKDDSEGMHSVRVTITDADGKRDVRTIGYTVDSAPPRFRVEVIGRARSGAEVTLRATQIATADDRKQAGLKATGTLSPGRALMLFDARRVEARLPDGAVLALTQRARGTWEARWRIPRDAESAITLHVFGVDVAANVADQVVTVEVAP